MQAMRGLGGFLVMLLTWGTFASADCLQGQVPCAACCTPPTTVTFTPDLDDSIDAYIQSASPYQNQGSPINILCGTRASGNVIRAMFRFDLSSLPNGATVTDCRLRLTVDWSSGLPATFRMYRTTVPWGEHQVAWLFPFQWDLPWATPGGDFTVNDASDLVTFSGVGVNEVTGLAAQANYALRHDKLLPMLMKADPESPGDHYVRFASGDITRTPDPRSPTLIVTYSSP